jgi:uncharacterized protein YgbK (DUF1537 family)
MLIAIIADDLTGAADSGVQLARAGYRTAVVFQGSSPPAEDGLDAVSVDTDSRPLPAGFAAERVVEAAHAVRDSRVVYKKLDSTLRGPVAAEIAAALEATGREAAVVAPALPAAGRTTVGGVQMVHGTPVHETEFANDPKTPVNEGHLPTLLADVNPEVGALSVEDVMDPAMVVNALREYRCVVVDAERNEDLEALVRAVPDPSAVLWAGSAGLAGALGAVYPGPHADEKPLPRSLAGGVLVVVGSLSGVVREQLRRLEDERGHAAIPLSAGEPSAVENAAREARAALAEDGCAALCSDEERGSSEGVVEALAEAVALLSDEGHFDALVLTGGDTAARVARRLGAGGIRLEGEIEPGVPVGILIGPRPYRVVTKAGGFGEPGTLVNVTNELLGGEED